MGMFMQKNSLVGIALALVFGSIPAMAQTNSYVNGLTKEEVQARDTMLNTLESDLNGSAPRTAVAPAAPVAPAVQAGRVAAAPAAPAERTAPPTSSSQTGSRVQAEQKQGVRVVSQERGKAQSTVTSTNAQQRAAAAQPTQLAQAVPQQQPSHQAQQVVPVLTASMPSEAIRAGDGYASDFDSFGRVLRMQSELEASSYQAKIHENRKQAGLEVEKPLSNPLANAKQLIINSEPVLEALWGIEGREVAEVSYKGEQIPVSRTNPVVSAKDGWELEEISQFQVTFVKKAKTKVLRRKVIPLSWSGEIFSNARINN